MPKVTEKQKRFEILDEYLCSGESTVDELARALGVSKNTIRNYVVELEETYPVKIRHDNGLKKESYYYDDADFSIRKINLSIDEMQRLKESISLLSRLQGTPQFEWLNSVNDRFKAKFAREERPTISFDESITKGREHFTPLYNAIINKHVLEITYQSFTLPEETVVFHPYFLKEYNNRWYIIGLCENNNTIYNYALDRIVTIKILPNNTFIDSKIDIDKYYDDVVGVTINLNKEPEDVVFKLTPSQYQYTKTKKIHHTQSLVKVERDEGNNPICYILKIHVRLNFELEQQFLSMGDNIEVLEPAEFRAKIKGRLSKALERYK